MAIIQPDRHRELNTTFSLQYRTAYRETTNWSDRISTEVPSSSKQNDFGWMARLFKMRKWDGPRLIQNLNAYNYIIVNDPYELTVGVDRDDLEDDNLGVYGPLFSEMGRQSRKLKDQQLKSLLQAGTTGLGFDGVAFFATTHPLDPAGNQSNLFAGTALTAANFDTVLTAMKSTTGEDGEPLGAFQNPADVVLIVPPALEYEARVIVNASRVDAGAGTSGGNSNMLQGAAQLLVVPELANEPTVWYLADAGAVIKPLVWQVRRENQMVSKDQVTDDGVFFDKQLVWGVDGRYGKGYGPWWLMARAAA